MTKPYRLSVLRLRAAAVLSMLLAAACQVPMDPADHTSDVLMDPQTFPDWDGMMEALPAEGLGPAGLEEPASPDGFPEPASEGPVISEGAGATPADPPTPDGFPQPEVVVRDPGTRTPLHADPAVPPATVGEAGRVRFPDPSTYETPVAPVAPPGPPPPTETSLLSERFGEPPPSPTPVQFPDSGLPDSSAGLGDLPGGGAAPPALIPGTPSTNPSRDPGTAPGADEPAADPWASAGTDAGPVDSNSMPTDPSIPAAEDAWDPQAAGLDMPPPSAFPRLPGEPAPPPDPTHMPEDPWGEGPGSDAGTVGIGSPDGGIGSPDGPASEDDPWAAAPSDGGAPATGAIDDQDPWGEAGSTDPAPGRSDARPSQVQAHVTRLRDRPGDPAIAGYPTSLLDRADASVALSPGSRACLVVFYDDSVRGSDLTAATLLPVLTRHAGRFDFVPVDRGPQAPAGPVFNALARRYLNGVPTVVVLPPDRAAPAIFWRDITAGAVDGALASALRAPAARTLDDAPREGGEYRAPGDRDPLESDPGTPPGGHDPAGPLHPDGAGPPSAPLPMAGTLDRHVRHLRERAGDPKLVGYPSTLLRSVPARTVLEPGQRPAVIIFYDNTSKASDKQAAHFLPVLARHQADIDLVLIDVSTRAKWNAYERKVVLTYYMSFVPTTAVLTARRQPVRSWFEIVGGAALQRAIQDANRRR